MSNRPIVSVVIPSYNYGRFLASAIKSIQEQSFDRWECIVIDDASEDDTESILEQLCTKEPRLRYQVLRTNAGPSAARNRALRLARGKYVQFLDADDQIETRKLELHSQYLDEHPDVDIVYGPYSFFTATPAESVSVSLRGKLSEPLMEPVSGRGTELIERLSLHNIMPINAALFRLELLEKIGGFDEEVRGCEDWNLLLHSAISGASIRFLPLQDARALIRSHDRSASREGERLLAGLITAAKHFEQNLAGPWSGPPPVAFQAASAIDLISTGSRWRGVFQLLRSASRAGWTLNSIRWIAYSAVGAVAPSRTFRRIAAAPVPEGLIELGFRLRRHLRKLKSFSDDTSVS